MNSTMSGRRSFLRVSMAVTVFALIAAATLAPASTVATNANGTVAVGPKALVGTWRVTVTTFPCANPQAKNPSFVSLLTFWINGSLIETTLSPRVTARAAQQWTRVLGADRPGCV